MKKKFDEVTNMAIDTGGSFFGCPAECVLDKYGVLSDDVLIEFINHIVRTSHWIKKDSPKEFSMITAGLLAISLANLMGSY